MVASMVVGFSTAALIAAWEDGMREPAVDRAPALLRPLGLVEAHRDPASMAVGECDVLLFELRRRLFGADLEMVGTCPSCRDTVEVSIPLAAVVPSRADADRSGMTLEEGGLRIRCRLPTNRDLRELAAMGPQATVEDLLDLCVEAVEGSDAGPRSAVLTPDAAERVVDALAARDPGADLTVEIRCPCGAQWGENLDIRSILWTELTRWVKARLAEVHSLARAYGWCERDILEMSPYRRRFYLEASA